MIVCLSAAHNKASLPMLESLNISDEDEVMKSLCSKGLVQECVLLQTCHRVEIYFVVKDSGKKDVINKVLKFWGAKAGVSFDVLSKVVEVYKGGDALIHLFYLASGLESVVLGEDQILGQVRSAYVRAKKFGSSGRVLEKTFMKAVNVGRRVRTETTINEKSVSISSVAVDLAEKDLGDLSLVKTLVIGAGEAGSIVAKTLRKRGVETIYVANRTFERGSELASKVGGKAVRFDRIWQVLPEVNLVIAAVSVGKPILESVPIEWLLSEGEFKKGLYVVDISQPRAVEEKVGSLPGVTLRNIDYLKLIVEENLRSRKAEVEKSKKIIFSELERFKRQLAMLFVEPLISEIHRKAEVTRQKQLGRAVRKMGESDERKLMVLDRFSRELVERILQVPIEQLRGAALNSNGSLLSAAEELFGIKSGKSDKVD